MLSTQSRCRRGPSPLGALHSIVTSRRTLLGASLVALFAPVLGGALVGCSLLVPVDDLAGGGGADARPEVIPGLGHDASPAPGATPGGGDARGDDAGAPGTAADAASPPPCVPETDAALCARLGAECGTVAAIDRCGAPRVVTSCGTCAATRACGGGGAPNVCGLSVVSFTLIDASITSVVNGAPVTGFDPIPPDAVIDRSVTGSSLSIRANTNPAVLGLVRFLLDGALYKTEHSAPYALCGDDGKGAWTSCDLAAGPHTLLAIPYDDADAAGTQGLPAMIRFTIR